jgi:hypothetical protein
VHLRKTLMMTMVTALLAVFALTASAAQFSGPTLLTNAGQSPDTAMARVLLNQTAANAELNDLATTANLNGKKSLVIVIGASSKGLGAAGINLNDEVARVTSLATAARQAGIKIIAMHLGGSQRRGQSSDKLIETVVPLADAVIVVESGNADGIFNKNLRSGAAFYSVDKIANAAAPLKELFNN